MKRVLPTLNNTLDQKGVALIIVLWIFIFLFAVAFNFSAAVREEAQAAHQFSEDTQGYYLAVAGFQRGLYEFLKPAQAQPTAQGAPPEKTPPGFYDGSWREEALGSGGFKVRLLDEGGKINLNRADETMLRRVLTNLEIDEPLRSTLIDSILDWIDPDDLHRASGAESDYYQSLSPAYSPRNGPFQVIEELLWVQGVTPELFYGSTQPRPAGASESRRVGFVQIFTVDSPIDRVNLRTAPVEVIHALMGMTLEKSRAFVEERKKLSDKTIGDLLSLLGVGAGDATMQMFVFTNPSVISIEAEGKYAGSPASRWVKGVVRGGGGRAELVRWIDRANAPAQD
jgi:general secretion pathway protein K